MIIRNLILKLIRTKKLRDIKTTIGTLIRIDSKTTNLNIIRGAWEEAKMKKRVEEAAVAEEKRRNCEYREFGTFLFEEKKKRPPSGENYTFEEQMVFIRCAQLRYEESIKVSLNEKIMKK